MADQTRVDVTTVTSSADAIGALLPPRSTAHERLGPGWTSPGPFEAAERLDQVVRERADGVVGYAGHLHTELATLRDALSAAAHDLATTDAVSSGDVDALRGRGAAQDV